MKRLISILIPLFILATTAITIAIGEARHPPNWQPELESYISSQTALSSGAFRVQSTIQANRPWQLSPDMVGRKTPNLSEDLLSFPPLEVWCIILEEDRSLTGDFRQAGAITVVFAARHETVHFTYWVIYEGASPPAAPTFQETLSRIGCNLELGLSKLTQLMKPGPFLKGDNNDAITSR